LGEFTKIFNQTHSNKGDAEMSKDWDILLDKCIDRMNEGASLEDCIAEHPEHAEELEPLLRVLCDARDTCSTMPRTTAKSVMRLRLGAALVDADGSVQKSHPRPSLLFGWSRTKAALAIVLVLALFGTGLFWALKPGEAPVLANIKPENESVIVDVNTIAITGKTLPDAVVLINGEMADVDSNGNFSFQVILDKGFNVFDIIAIDEIESEVTTQIIIYLIPSHDNNGTKVPVQLNAPLWVTYNGMDDGRI
jgi:hypothetical protein